MTKEDFLEQATSWSIDSALIKTIGKEYSQNLPELLQRILSHAVGSIFLDDARVLSFSEVLNAEENYQVDFGGRGIIPVIDIYDNVFIVYDYMNDVWALFDIIDEVLFEERGTLEEVLVS